MVKGLTWILEHWSGGMWFEHVRLATEQDWNTAAIIIISFMGLMIILSIINFRGRWRDRELTPWPFFGLVLAYQIVNIIMVTVVCIIGMSVGGFYGLGVGAGVFLIAMAVICWNQWVEDGDELDGIFRASEFVTTYSDTVSKFYKYRKETKKQYNKYLHIEY